MKLTFFLLTCFLTACGEKNNPPPVIPVQESRIVEQPQLTIEQQQQLLQTIISRAIDILAGRATLAIENDPVFGAGEYFWPKDPKKPIKAIVYFKKTIYPDVGAELRRLNEGSAWNLARIYLGYSPLYEQGVQFAQSYFSDLGLTFDRAYREPDINTPDDLNQGSNHFVFKLNSNPKISVEFGGDQHLSDLKDQFPKMFLYCIVSIGH